MTDAELERIDRLYQLLPVVYRQRDVAEGTPLRDLLRVIAEQVNVIEDDIAAMYDDWFIETCRDWVVPYIADLVGYQAVHTGVTDVEDLETRLRVRALAPRRAVANYIRDLRRRGTLALLENLAGESAGLPSRAVEFYALLGRTQSLDHVNRRGRIVDLRDSEALDLIDSPFDRIAHTVDLRSVLAPRRPGRYNIPSAAAFVWRLRSYPVTDAPAAFSQQRSHGYAFYTFSVLGNDAPLFTEARPEADSTGITREINVPAPIRRRALELHRDDYYGVSKSLAIWIDDAERPVPAGRIIAADLTGWKYRPREGDVAVDPELGRIVITQEANQQERAVRVSYRYGFPGDVGAHESPRVVSQPRQAELYRVGATEAYEDIGAALDQWRKDAPAHAVVEIADGRVHGGPFADIVLREGVTLQIRAANRRRPVLRLVDYSVSRGERLRVLMHPRARFTLDGIMLTGRPLRIDGAGHHPVDVRVAIRRSTLVPGWDLRHDCEPVAPDEASLELANVSGEVTIDRSILGTIAALNRTAEEEPIAIRLRDSIVDATRPDLEAVMGPNAGYAWAVLTVSRCTIVGRVLAHAMELGENSIFASPVRIVRRQWGCVRFCYVPPESRTPRRYHCQPELAVDGAREGRTDEEEGRRVAPRFTSTRFGDHGYCQLASDCAPEISTGADDASEMGAFHDLFAPQRAANLRARLDQSTPAGMQTGIIYVD
jgi:hypothetical protein